MTGELHAIRTDVVGSLLRPPAWLEARQGFDDQRISLDALREIELTCVRELIALQESVGLDVVTDGEISRLNFQDSFGLAVSGLRCSDRNTACAQTSRSRRSTVKTLGHSRSCSDGHRGFAPEASDSAIDLDQ